MQAGGRFGKSAEVLIFINLWSELPKGAEILASYDKGWEVMKRSRRLDFSLDLSGTLVEPLIICVKFTCRRKGFCDRARGRICSNYLNGFFGKVLCIIL